MQNLKTLAGLMFASAMITTTVIVNSENPRRSVAMVTTQNKTHHIENQNFEQLVLKKAQSISPDHVPFVISNGEQAYPKAIQLCKEMSTTNGWLGLGQLFDGRSVNLVPDDIIIYSEAQHTICPENRTLGVVNIVKILNGGEPTSHITMSYQGTQYVDDMTLKKYHSFVH
jgi:hypothetical protein